MTLFSQLKKQYWLQQNAVKPEPLPRVPAGYVETAAIYTDKDGAALLSSFVISSDDEWIVTCARANDAEGNKAVLGTGQSKTDSNMALWLNATTNLVEFTFGDGGSSAYKVTTSAYDVKQMHTYRMKLSTGEAWIDGDYIGKSASLSSVPNPKPLALFGSYRGSSINSHFRGAMADVIVKRNGTEVAHWIPFEQNTGNISFQAGMYDIINDEALKSGNSLIGYYSYDADWKIQVAASEQYDIALSSFYLGENATLDWGDGNMQSYNANVTGTLSHTYESAGEYSLSLHVPFGTTLWLNAIGASSDSGNSTVKSCSLTSTQVPEKCFFGCNAMTSVKLNGRMGMIWRQAFQSCQELVLDSLPNGISIFGGTCFYNCKKMTLSRLPDRTHFIYNMAFKDSGVTVTELPEGTVLVASEAFRECTGITSMTLPSTVETVGGIAFLGCTNMSTVVFKGVPTSISDSAFRHVSGTIYVPWDSTDTINVNAPWESYATIVYNYTA